MSKILTQEELNEVKTLAGSLGFESKILTNYAKFSKRFNETTHLFVFYDVVGETAYVEMHSGSVSIVTEEFEQFIKVMNQARIIAKKLTE